MLWQSHIGIINEEKLAARLTSCFNLFPQLAQEASTMIGDATNFYIGGSGLMDFSQVDETSLLLRKQMENETGLGENALKELAEIALDKYEPTVWGYINAITEYAQRYDVERRSELEQIAGDILNMPEKYFVA